jgi:hypothetical protein
MNLLLSVLVLGLLVFGYSFLPWYIDSVLAFGAAIYFACRGYTGNSQEYLWSAIAFGLGVLILLLQFNII